MDASLVFEKKKYKHKKLGGGLKLVQLDEEEFWEKVEGSEFSENCIFDGPDENVAEKLETEQEQRENEKEKLKQSISKVRSERREAARASK